MSLCLATTFVTTACPTSTGTPAEPEPDVVTEGCGNGIRDLGEVCDGNDMAGETCTSLGLGDGTLTCRDDCSGFDRTQCGESSTCGDGVRADDELCDTNDLGGATCDALGFNGGTVRCSASCTLDTSNCGAPLTCGDGIVQDGEVCDSAALAGETCEGLGFGAGTLLCADDCLSYNAAECGAGPSCGNGVLDDPNEVCDVESFGGATCASEGFAPGFLTCRPNCTGFSTENCGPPLAVCGDGIIDEDQGEECEPGNLNSKTCDDFTGLAGEGLTCNPDTCTFDVSACCVPDCGDAECGLDPVCGSQCEDFCADDEICSDDNTCFDPCAEADCSGQGTCIVDDGEARCECNEGLLNGPDLTCVENPCDGATCSGQGECVLTDNVASCQCNEGYVAGDDLTCVNPCEGETCSGNGTCSVVEGAAQCTCDSGYINDGALACVYDDPCNGETCSGHGQCTSSNGTAQCICDFGYTANGLTCVDNSDPCDGQTCSNHGFCSSSNGTAQCICDSGYTANGLTCVENGGGGDACDGITCSGQGQCVVDPEGTAGCACNPGYALVESITECTALPTNEWVCPVEYQGDGECDCGCNAPDPDCADSAAATCAFSSCGYATVPVDGQNHLCEPL